MVLFTCAYEFVLHFWAQYKWLGLLLLLLLYIHIHVYIYIYINMYICIYIYVIYQILIYVRMYIVHIYSNDRTDSCIDTWRLSILKTILMLCAWGAIIILILFIGKSSHSGSTTKQRYDRSEERSGSAGRQGERTECCKGGVWPGNDRETGSYFLFDRYALPYSFIYSFIRSFKEIIFEKLNHIFLFRNSSTILKIKLLNHWSLCIYINIKYILTFGALYIVF